MSSLTTKRTVFALVALSALVLLLTATRTWLVGRTSDPLLGGGDVTATGSQVAPGLVALAAVALVGLVAALTGGPRIRRSASVVILLAAGAAVLVTVSALRDPQAALGRVAAAGLGRIGEVQTTATATSWAWVALGSGLLLVLSCGLTVVAVGRWTGLSSRFEAPLEQAGYQAGSQPGSQAGSQDRSQDRSLGRGVRRSAWDELSEGGDPTLPGRSQVDDGPT